MDRQKLIKSLSESISTMQSQNLYALPAMDSFIKRHIKELQKTIEFLKTNS